MKIAGLVIGILMMIVSGIAFIVCLLLPAITNNHVSRGESMMGIIPSVVIFLFATVVTIISAVVLMKNKRAGGGAT